MMCKRIFAYQTQSEGEIPFFKIGTIGSSPDAYISQELFDDYKEKYNYPRVNEVMITCAGTVGRCWQFDGTPSYYQDSNIVWIDNPQGKISNNFIYRILERTDWSKLNSTTITRIYNDNLRNLNCYYPAIEEQNKITDFLSLIDKRIEKQRQLVESLKKYKRGLLSAIFERKIRFKDENGNDYPEWIYTTIKSALNYEQPQKYIVKTENYNDNYDTPVLTANKAFVLGYTDEKDGIYNKGNVIIYDDFTMDFKFVEFNFKVKSSTIKMLTAKENYNLYFIFNLLTHLNLKPQGHQRSYISILEPMEFLCPTFKEQNKIASFLYDIDKKIEQQFKYLNKLEFTKKGLLQQMFI